MPCMGRPEQGHADARKALAKTRCVPRHVRLLAVRAELEQGAEPTRNIAQKRLADMYGVTARMLRHWFERHLSEGAEGLRASGGRGRKMGSSRKDVDKAIDACMEPGRGQEKGGGGEGAPRGPCRDEDARGSGGGGRGGAQGRAGGVQVQGRVRAALQVQVQGRKGMQVQAPQESGLRQGACIV